MLSFVLKRSVSLALSLLAASLVIFFVINVVPGDPARFMLGMNAQPEALESLRQQLGLDQPLFVQYLEWIQGLLVGEFGTSYTYKVPVAELIADRLWVSLPLAAYALTLSTLLAFPAGILSATKRNSPTDLSIMGLTQLGIAIPNFWFAMLLVLLFSIVLQWFSAGGFPGGTAGSWWRSMP
ncbi:ABC transporter permease [Fodinicurvata halophila]|uniref:ABC transporter permease n=1 Tax=Fodinicurvata halophila TaxID=1419723 RepID=UPI00363E1701